ncbi:MAG: Xaa-Pro peptidase family protein [Actinomycetes bacterium]
MPQETLSPIDVSRRIDAVRNALQVEDAASHCSAVLITSAVNIRWLTGFTGSAGIVLISLSSQTPSYLITDGRYIAQAEQQLRNSKSPVEIVEKRSFKEQLQFVVRKLEECLPSKDERSLGIESHDVSVEMLQQLEAEAASQGNVREKFAWHAIQEVFVNLRRKKTPAELERISLAASIADEALQSVMHLLVPGVCEEQFCLHLDHAMREIGAQDVSFPSIVAFGENSALPHHRPSRKVLHQDEVVVIDFGALVDGYHSDMTRSFVSTNGSTARGKELLARFDAVKLACEEGGKLVAPGVLAASIDSRCREVLEQAGLENELNHGVGHGVGLLIHEAPWINPRSLDVLCENDVVTVEPGAYRMGLGGVRVEDLFIVTSAGHINISRSPKTPYSTLNV